MKKFIAIFALLGILLQTFSQVVILAEYYANKDYIAKNLCENRAKPMMHCDGKCCLKRKLAKDGKEQAPSQRNQRSEEVATLFFSETSFEIIHSFLAADAVAYSKYNDHYTASYYAAVFHPPSV